MIIGPAVFFGLLVVFILGGFIAYVVRDLAVAIAKKRSDRAPEWLKNLSEKNIEKLAIICGAVAVVLVILIMVTKTKWGVILWIALTILGILFGLSTFLLFGSTKHVQTYRKQESNRPTGIPHATTNNDRWTPPAYSAPVSKEDPYRELIARVKYDQGLADQLIENERSRLPTANLDQVCRSILEKLNRDRQL